MKLIRVDYSTIARMPFCWGVTNKTFLRRGMDVAEDMAYLSSCTRAKMGASIFKRGTFVAASYNMNKTHPKFGSKAPFYMLHAEGAAIYRAYLEGLASELPGSIMYVFRENGNLAKPCKDCQKLIKDHGIVEVFYSQRT